MLNAQYFIVVGISSYLALSRSCSAAESPDGVTAGSRRTDLPDIRRTDIKRHKNASTGVWVTFRDGVYDVTDFVVEHPGDKILLAAGGAVDRFWHCYSFHHAPHVYEQLEQLRIGNLHPDDAAAFESDTRPVAPTVEYVSVDGVGVRMPMNMSVSEMKTRFEVVTVTDTPIGDVSGVRLSDVLAFAGVREDDIEDVTFQGGDMDVEETPRGTSIPAATAMDPHEGVLLALEIDGESLSRDHGGPCRVVVPGLSRSKQVKWLRRITTSRSATATDSH